MRMQKRLIVVVTGLLAGGLAAPSAMAYSLMLPNPMPAPALPYCSAADGWGGAAVVEMAANSCAGAAGRKHLAQADIWASIQAHNKVGEPAPGWYSDPQGVAGALEDGAFGICGGWHDASDTDRSKVLGKMLFWLRSYKYLGLVSTGSFEHWQVLRGFWTDVEPTSTTTTVTLHEVYLYDPDYPCDTKIVSGGAFLSSALYWGVPVDRPGSAWHGHYVAVGEPPTLNIRVRVRELATTGTIIPFTGVLPKLRAWARDSEVARELGLPAAADGAIEQVLVKQAHGSYYLTTLRLGDGRQAEVILNAYTGDFEEMRVTPVARTLRQSDTQLREVLQAQLAPARLRLSSVAAAEYTLDPKLAGLDRYEPVQRVRVRLAGPQGGGETERTLVLDRAGDVLKGLE
jgi:hypothetical protein